MRAATHWHKTQINGKSIWWIDGDEGTGQRVCSVLDPERDADAVRITGPDSSEPIHPDDDPTPPRGLIVYGRSKWDRPTFDQFATVAPEYEHLVESVRQGRALHHDHPDSPRAA